MGRYACRTEAAQASSAPSGWLGLGRSRGPLALFLAIARSTAAACSVDHLIGAQQDRLRHSKAERLGSLEVHDHLELCRKLHRKIAWFRAA